MLGRRRAFAVEPLGGRDRAGENLAQGCVVPGVTSTYRRILDASQGCSLGSRKGDGEVKGLWGQVPLLKLASRDSGVEMAVGDSSLTTLPGLSEEALDFEPAGSREPLALPVEPPAHLGRLLASRKLEQVLERSSQLPTSPVSLSQHRLPKADKKPEYKVPLFGARDQEATKAETDQAAGPEAEVVRGVGPKAWASLPGQGLRYLEHLCLVLEQVVRLQQLYLQLQTQRLPGDPAEEKPTLAPLPPPSHAPGSGVHGSWELLSQTEETGVGRLSLPPSPAGLGPQADPLSPRLDCYIPVPGPGSPDSLSEGAKRASFPKVAVPSAHPPGLSDAPTGPAQDFPCSQSHKRDLSHWNKVKVLLNRIRWKSSQHPEPPAPPHGPAPRIGSRDFSERSPCRPLRKTFMPSLVVKKQRAKKPSCLLRPHGAGMPLCGGVCSEVFFFALSLFLGTVRENCQHLSFSLRLGLSPPPSNFARESWFSERPQDVAAPGHLLGCQKSLSPDNTNRFLRRPWSMFGLVMCQGSTCCRCVYMQNDTYTCLCETVTVVD